MRAKRRRLHRVGTFVVDAGGGPIMGAAATGVGGCGCASTLRAGDSRRGAFLRHKRHLTSPLLTH
jgi:hypothetical protein